MKPWHRIQKDSIGKELLVREGGKKEQVGRLVGGEDGGEPGGNLSEAILVPQRLAAIEWWSKDNLKIQQSVSPGCEVRLWINQINL